MTPVGGGGLLGELPATIIGSRSSDRSWPNVLWRLRSFSGWSNPFSGLIPKPCEDGLLTFGVLNLRLIPEYVSDILLRGPTGSSPHARLDLWNGWDPSFEPSVACAAGRFTRNRERFVKKSGNILTCQCGLGKNCLLERIYFDNLKQNHPFHFCSN